MQVKLRAQLVFRAELNVNLDIVYVGKQIRRICIDRQYSTFLGTSLRRVLGSVAERVSRIHVQLP